jgi:hypothetical protein
MTQACTPGDVARSHQVRLMGELCSTLEDRRSSSSMAGEQMLRKILQIQVFGWRFFVTLVAMVGVCKWRSEKTYFWRAELGQLVLAELLDTQEEQAPLEMAQKVALIYRDKEEVIEEIDLLVADTLNMTADERPRKTVLNKVRELAMAYRQKVDRPECNVGTQTGHDTWLERVVRTGPLNDSQSRVSGCVYRPH